MLNNLRVEVGITMNIAKDVWNRLKLRFKRFKVGLLTKKVIILNLGQGGGGGDFDSFPSSWSEVRKRFLNNVSDQFSSDAAIRSCFTVIWWDFQERICDRALFT